jgi:hypothetical protein
VLSAERFTALIDANAQGDPELIWVPLDIEEYLVQPGLVGTNILKEGYKFAHDIRERILSLYPDLNPDHMAIVLIMKGRPSLLDISDVEIGYADDDVLWLK